MRTSTTIGAIPSNRWRSTPTVITSPERAASATRNALPNGTRASCSDVSEPRVLRLFRHHARGVLDAAASRAKPVAAGGELRLLWLGPSVVAGAAVCDHARGLLV